MKRIFKYELEMRDTQTVALPRNGVVLSVVNQNERMMMYALVDDLELATEDVKFIIHGTGHEANDIINARFVSTVLLRGATIVFHVFTNG